MSAVLLDNTGTVKSSHEFLFFYGGCSAADTGGGESTSRGGGNGPSAVRYGAFKAYWCTAPGLGGCSLPSCKQVKYAVATPLLFNLWEDPSEAYPLTPVNPAPNVTTSSAAYDGGDYTNMNMYGGGGGNNPN